VRKLIVATAAVIAAAALAPAAHAENVGTTTGGPLIAAPAPLTMKAMKLAEGQTRAQKISVPACQWDECEIRIHPMAGTASIYDYNPFAYYTRTLDRGESWRVVVKMTAFTDTKREPTERFQLVAEQYDSNTTGTHADTENAVNIMILDRTPLPALTTTQIDQTATAHAVTPAPAGTPGGAMQPVDHASDTSQTTTTPNSTSASPQLMTSPYNASTSCRACAYTVKP
jgi:hypothetical protein